MDNPQTLLDGRMLLRAMGSIDEIAASNGLERIDLTQRDRIVSRSFDLLIRGWIGDGSTVAAAQKVTALVDGRPVPIRYRNSRPDVATITGRPELETSGFRLVVDTASLAVGFHTVRIVSQQADGNLAELEPLAFELVGAEDRTSLNQEIFSIEIDAFHDDHLGPCRSTRIEKGYVAIVRGSLRELRGGIGAAGVHALVDSFDGVRGLTGYLSGGDPSGFSLFFPTRELDLGPHTLHIIARSVDGRHQRFGPFRFDVVPTCCALAHPVPAHVRARAEMHVVRSEHGAVHVRGWAIDPITQDSIGQAVIAFENGPQYWMTTRQHRPDVGRHYAHPNAAYCGFVGSIVTATLGAGTHVGRLFVRSKDDVHYFETDASITIPVGL